MGEQLEHRLVHQLRVGPLEARVARSGQPVLDDALELLRRVPGVRRHHELEEAVLARGGERAEVALERRLERLPGRPVRVLVREGLHAVDREQQLEVGRLLAPQSAVVVEDGDAPGPAHRGFAECLRVDRRV
jgi:hypothetical protein